MRMKMELRLKDPQLPLEYRRSFLSLLKRSFQQASQEVYETLYENGTAMKPFTFSVYLPGAEFREDGVSINGPYISLFFSTVRSDLGIYFYNSLIKSRFSPFPLAKGNELSLRRVLLIKEKSIHSNEAVFKTLSPFLVRHHTPGSNRDRYLLPGDSDFCQKFKDITCIQLQAITGQEEEIEIEPVMLSKIPVRHFGCLMESNKGIIKLKGKAQALNTLHQAGTGSRRSEGFGMLELLS